MSSPPWFRLDSDILDDRRLRWATKKLGLRKCEMVGTWIYLLDVAFNSPQEGKLLRWVENPEWVFERLLSETEIASDLDISLAEARFTLDTLLEIGLLRYDGTVLCIAEWRKHKPPVYEKPLRRWIMRRDNFKCRYCGRRAEHIDHIIPRCQGGEDHPSNLAAACASCNLSKGGRTPEEAGMVLL